MDGQRIAHYQIQSRLGGGGMGEVWKAYDPKLQRTVAIKVLTDHADDAAGRILAEARAASGLSHPNICTVHDVGDADGRSFIVMEHVEGKPLSELIPSEGLPPETVIRYGTQIADALAHAHEHGIVHRDLKSANVVVTPDAQVRLIDFGIALPLPERAAEAVTKTLAAPVSSTAVGTLAYMAPEVLKGETATAQSDIWSLGVLLYEMVTGTLPFSGTTQTQVVSAILIESPLPLPAWCAAGLRTIAQRLLAKEIGLRYGTAVEVRAALEALGSSAQAGSSSAGERSTPASIAVLPFANMSSDPEQEYFCDGIAEEITSALVKVDRLRVAGRTSAFAFKGKTGVLSEIGRTLNVGAVLEGSVRRAGNRVRITAELVNVSDGYHLWSERYDRELADIFAVQDDIALAVVDALKVTLLGAEQGAVLKHSTEDPEAYQLCLKARHAWYQWTREGLQTAMNLFQQAVEADPSYALAHFGLGDCATASALLGQEPPNPSRIRTHLEAAIRLDPGLAEAPAVLGWIVDGLDEWNWPLAESRCRKALASNPRSAHVRLVHALELSVTGRVEDAVAQMRLALDLDPLNPFLNSGLLECLLGTRDWEAALRHAQKTLEMAPDSWMVQWLAGQAQVAAGHLDEAVSTFERSVASSAEAPLAIGLLGNALARAGRRDEARRQLDRLHERATSDYVSPLAPALVYAGLREWDDAFTALEQTLEAREQWLPLFLTFLPTLDDLRPDPRFAELRRRVGL